MKSRLVQWMFFSFMVTVVTHQSYAIEWPHFNPSALQSWSQTAQQLNSLVAASQSTTDTLQDEINQLAHIDLKKFDDMLKSYGVRIDHLETDKASTQYVDQQVKTLNTDLGTKVTNTQYEADKTQLSQDIAANKQALADKVSQSTYNARVTKVDQQLGKHAQDLNAWINGGKVTDAKGKEIAVPSITDTQAMLASKVANATYQQDKTAINGKITDNAQAVTALQNNKVDTSTYQTDKTQLDQDIAANKQALTGKVSQAAYDQDQGVVNQKITQNTTSIESEQVNTLHMLKGGLVSTASGNVTLNNGLQTIDQEIDKIRASAVGDKVCTPMTGQALLTDLQSAACNNIILYKQAYVLPTYYVSIANKHIYAATRMPVTITAKNVGHFDIGGQVSLEGVHRCPPWKAKGRDG